MTDHDEITHREALVPAPAAHPAAALQTSIASMSQPLARYLEEMGLPIDNVVVPIAERQFVIDSLAAAIRHLPLEERTQAAYLSKFVISAGVGLFDASINYLWNETVSALRRLATTTD